MKINTSKPEARMNLKKSFSVLMLSLILSSVSHAEDNPLLGKWRWSTPDCNSPELSFEKNQITISGNADGTDFKHVFKKVKYHLKSTEVEVGFGKAHGFSKAADKNRLSFKILSPDKFEIVRKSKTMNEINRCL